MTCKTTRSLFSSYLDGAVNGSDMRAIATHLEGCGDCRREFDQWRDMQHILERVGPSRSPAQLGLELRLAISREAARSQGHWYDGISLAWDNQIRPALLQVSAGLASALVLVGSLTLLVGMVAAPQAVLANDEPLGALTTPHFLYSVAPAGPLLAAGESTIVVQADINGAGEIYNYAILSGPLSVAAQTELRDQLMVQQYEPARVFGEPVRSHILITFSGVSVQG